MATSDTPAVPPVTTTTVTVKTSTDGVPVTEVVTDALEPAEVVVARGDAEPAPKGFFDALGLIRQLSGIVNLAKVPAVLQNGLALFGADFSTKEGVRELVTDALGMVCAVTELTYAKQDDVLCDMANRVAADGPAVDTVTDILFTFFGRPEGAKAGATTATLQVTDMQQAVLISAIRPEGAKAVDLATLMTLLQTLATIISIFRRK